MRGKIKSALMLSILLISTIGPVLAGEDISSLWVVGISLSILFVFLGYILSRKTKIDIILDIKKYELQFEQEYRNFVSEIDEPNEDTNHISKDIPAQEDKW